MIRVNDNNNNKLIKRIIIIYILLIKIWYKIINKYILNHGDNNMQKHRQMRNGTKDN